MRGPAVVALLLLGCGAIKSAGGEVGGTAVEWIACPVGLIDCGHVYVCGDVEICINDDDSPQDFDAAEAKYGTCSPTERHEGICRWHCDKGPGCNALDSCFCPMTATTIPGEL
jgi:hypothetical protein